MAEESSRVAMVWPTSLKERVREVAGPRGITEFTIAAVEERLAALPPRPQGVRVPIPPPPPPPPPAPTPQRGPGASDEFVRADEVRTNGEGWATLPPEPELLADDSETCPTCGNPLIDGECWTCGG